MRSSNPRGQVVLAGAAALALSASSTRMEGAMQKSAVPSTPEYSEGEVRILRNLRANGRVKLTETPARKKLVKRHAIKAAAGGLYLLTSVGLQILAETDRIID